MQTGRLTKAGEAYSRCLADYLMFEQDTDLVENGKEILVLTGTCRAIESTVKIRPFLLYVPVWYNVHFFPVFLFVLRFYTSLCLYDTCCMCCILIYNALYVCIIGTTTLHSESTRALKERGFRVYPTPVLNELRGGDYHGLTKDQFKVQCCVLYVLIFCLL